MSIALERGGEIGQSGLGRSSGCSPNYKAVEIAGNGRKLKTVEAAEEEMSTCTSSSSSIGKNSESLGSDGEDMTGEKEVQSAYKGPMSALESLEEALPIRRGISSFYDGKSKSFTSLSDATASSAYAKDLGKQENAYTRKRRNLLASKNFSFKSLLSSSGPLRSNGVGISKRPLGSGRSMRVLAAVTINNSSTEEQEQQSRRLLPPLPPSGKNIMAAAAAASSRPQYCFFPMRSFSWADLQGMAAPGSSIGLHDHY